jgi:hypothetical protein
MSIKFDPSNNNIQLNSKDTDYYSEPKNVPDQNQSTDNCYVDMYVLQLNDQSDSDILKILKDDKTNINAKLTIIDRRSQKEIVKEYKDGIEISKPYYGSNDIFFNCLDEITLETNVDKICLDIYKKYIEKYVLTRSNKFVHYDYLLDVYLVFSNILHKEIFMTMKHYFEETIKCSSVKLHLVYIKPKSSEYMSSCIVC